MSTTPTGLDDIFSSGRASRGIQPEVDVATVISTLLALPQPDDAGAQTADRYEWQAAMATADALALHFQFIDGAFSGVDASQVQIICEFHEDWVVQIGAQAELVSAKHRDPQIGPWKTALDLVDKGGLGHLFSRWLAAECLPTARLVTNAAIASGDAASISEYRALLDRKLREGVLSDDETKQCDNALDAFCRAAMKHSKGIPNDWKAPEYARTGDLLIPEDLLKAGSQFLRILRIDQQRPSRSHTSHAGPSLYAEPLARKLGIDLATAKPIWETVLALFRIRMRARGENERGGLPSVGGLSTPSFEEVLIDERAINVEDLQLAISTCARHPRAFVKVLHPQRLTKLSMKMAAGDCADTSMERAEQLRLDYVRYRRERRNAVPGSIGDLRKIEQILHRIADEETQNARSLNEAWGSDLWSGLSTRFSQGVHELDEYDIEGDIGLGGVCQLAQDCKVWFSGNFDVDKAIADAKTEKGAGNGS